MEGDARLIAASSGFRHIMAIDFQEPPGMQQNLVTVETFGIRGGLIHEVDWFRIR
jgi:hypothetical protein